MAEHQHISKKADEERQKRPDYRRLIEHDSFPFQRQHDQACVQCLICKYFDVQLTFRSFFLWLEDLCSVCCLM